MKEVYTEKRAEDFLASRGFDVIDGVFVSKKKDLLKAITRVGFPLVMKVSGKKIIHKNKVHGVIVGVTTFHQVEKNFNTLMEISGAEGVMFQPKISGKEFLIGIKDTPEFGRVIAFGAGGVHTEEIGDVSFRSIDRLNISELDSFISEVKISKKISPKEKSQVKRIVMQLAHFTRIHPEISELDINPLIDGKIVDARIAFS